MELYFIVGKNLIFTCQKPKAKSQKPNWMKSTEPIITHLFKQKGIRNFEDAIEYVRHIPYGRNKSRSKFSLVLKDNCGTCSSKHALLKLYGDELGLVDVNLLLVYYRMSEVNTPAIGDALTRSGLDYIPEAHCILEYNHDHIDVTSSTSSFEAIRADVIEIKKINPSDVIENKIAWHQEYIKSWIASTDIQRSFAEIWAIRERCIAQLTK